MRWFKVPPKVYFKRGALDVALRILKDKKRAFIVTDTHLFNSGAVDKVTKILNEIDVEYQIFFDIKPDPTMSNINQALTQLRPYEPDVIIALGGGSPLDAAKVIWLLYEQPEVDIKTISLRTMDIEKRLCLLPDLGQKAKLVCITTTSGTGSEVTPFSIITDDKTGTKYTLADYAMTPDIAIIDPNFVDSMPKELTASTGINALVHAIEAYVSCLSTNFTNSNSLEAIKLIFRYLERSYKEGAGDPIAREKMHYAASIAGMSFANSFLGLCHSMAYKLGTVHNVQHGVANALLIRQIIRFNSNKPEINQEEKTSAVTKYSQISDELGLGGENKEEKIERLITAIEGLMTSIDLPLSIKDYGVSEEAFAKNLEELVELAFNDQCTGANPGYPNKEELKKIYTDAYYGNV